MSRDRRIGALHARREIDEPDADCAEHRVPLDESRRCPVCRLWFRDRAVVTPDGESVSVLRSKDSGGMLLVQVQRDSGVDEWYVSTDLTDPK